jgi:glycosyltransferase involved in cell wall biosynthesis
MGKVEVLLATMNRVDALLTAREMNADSDILIANQAREYRVDLVRDGSRLVRMFTTPDRGVGRNRNVALVVSQGDYLLFSDDGVQYADGVSSMVSTAFQENTSADILIFEVAEKGGRALSQPIRKASRVRLWNFGSYGTYHMAMRRVSWVRQPIFFSELFGGGAMYGSGEDTLFLREALRKRMRIYTVPIQIGTADQSKSTWFTGFDEKFFYDKGALLAQAFPVLSKGLWLYFLMKFKKESTLGSLECVRLLFGGMRGVKRALPYAEWKALRERRS